MQTCKHVEYATIFSNLMEYIWGDEELHHPIVRALGNQIKTHNRINPECALAVLNVFWPQAELSPRLLPQDNEVSDGTVLYDVTFPDDSRALIETCRGVGHSVELY